MGSKSAIEWTDATWNPWMGCTQVSEGCRSCYAARDMKRYGRNFQNLTLASNTTLWAPQTWKASRIFVCSWSDFFHADVDPNWRETAWHMMASWDQHTYIIPTKRPENVMDMLPGWWKDSSLGRRCWLLISTENQKRFYSRMASLSYVINYLKDSPFAVYGLSVEPMLGPVSLCPWEDHIDWVVCGSESGAPGRQSDRLTEFVWAKLLHADCKKAGIPFFFKQWASRAGAKLIKPPRIDGDTCLEFPGSNRGKLR